MFNDYCSKNNLDNSRIRISDASGVSKNNLVSADFITEFLKLNKDNEVLAKLPKPGEGTLTHRLVPIKNNLRAKTGTLSDISTIAGYLKTRSGKNYVFCIMINDMKLLQMYFSENQIKYPIIKSFFNEIMKIKSETVVTVEEIINWISNTGKNLVFCIMINDMKLSGSDKKMLEDFILREAYLRL